jgi:hypothetical protein
MASLKRLLNHDDDDDDDANDYRHAKLADRGGPFEVDALRSPYRPPFSIVMC